MHAYVLCSLAKESQNEKPFCSLRLAYRYAEHIERQVRIYSLVDGGNMSNIAEIEKAHRAEWLSYLQQNPDKILDDAIQHSIDRLLPLWPSLAAMAVCPPATGETTKRREQSAKTTCVEHAVRKSVEGSTPARVKHSRRPRTKVPTPPRIRSGPSPVGKIEVEGEGGGAPAGTSSDTSTTPTGRRPVCTGEGEPRAHGAPLKKDETSNVSKRRNGAPNAKPPKRGPGGEGI